MNFQSGCLTTPAQPTSKVANSDEIIKPNLDKFNFEVDLLNQAKVMEACRVSNNEKRYVETKEIK